MSNSAPTFGLWYDFRQKLPFTEKYKDFYAECLEEIEEVERLGFISVWLSETTLWTMGTYPRRWWPRRR